MSMSMASGRSQARSGARLAPCRRVLRVRHLHTCLAEERRLPSRFTRPVLRHERGSEQNVLPFQRPTTCVHYSWRRRTGHRPMARRRQPRRHVRGHGVHADTDDLAVTDPVHRASPSGTSSLVRRSAGAAGGRCAVAEGGASGQAFAPAVRSSRAPRRTATSEGVSVFAKQTRAARGSPSAVRAWRMITAVWAPRTPTGAKRMVRPSRRRLRRPLLTRRSNTVATVV